MANLWGAALQALGGDTSGILDMRSQIEAQSAFNPYIQQQQQEQATRNANLAQSQMGMAPGSLDHLSGPGGLLMDDNFGGLLQDPVFAQRKGEMEAAIDYMGNPGTAQMGQQIMNSIMTGAQRDRVDASNNEIAIAQAARVEQRAVAADERQAANDRFDRGQALNQDYERVFANVKQAVDQFGLLEQSIGDKSPIGLTGSIFQLAKLFDPGSRTVTEGDVTTIEGSFPFQQQINTALSKLQGGGWDERTAQQILGLAGKLTQQQVNQNAGGFENLITRAQRADVDPRDVIGAYGLDKVYMDPNFETQFLRGVVPDVPDVQDTENFTYSNEPPAFQRKGSVREIRRRNRGGR